jgi:hypothetical protein
MKIADELAKLHKQISFENAGTSREERIKIMEAAAAALGESAANMTSQPIEKVLELLPDCLEVRFRRRAGRYELILHELDVVQYGDTLAGTISGAIREAMQVQLDNFDGFEQGIEATRDPKNA